MKVTVWESDFTFGIDLYAETLEDAVWLARWNQNTLKDSVSFGAEARKYKSFSGYCYWQVKKDVKSRLKR